MSFLRRLCALAAVGCCAAMVAALGGCGRSYHVTETYELQSNCDDNEAFLALVVPRSGPYQKVANLKVTWEGEAVKEVVGPNDVLRLRGAVGRQAVAVVDYDLLLADKKPHPQDRPTTAELAAEDGIESDDPFMVHQARLLASGTSRQDAYRIFEFVGQRIKQGQPAATNQPPSALRAYRNCTGACEERARLMVAILRAAGIPARKVDGLLITRGGTQTATWDHPAASHAWVEFFVDERWEPADPSAAAGHPSPSKFDAHGELIAYGESNSCRATCSRLEAEARDWALPNGKMLATPSSPLRFVAASKDPACTLVPSVTVRKLMFAPPVRGGQFGD